MVSTLAYSSISRWKSPTAIISQKVDKIDNLFSGGGGESCQKRESDKKKSLTHHIIPREQMRDGSN